MKARSLLVEIVELDHIDVIGLENRQALFHIPDNVLFGVRGGPGFGGQEDLVPQALDGLGHDLLVLAVHVTPGRIDVIDALVQAGPDDFRLGSQHGPEADHRDFQAGAAQGPVNRCWMFR